MAKTPHSSWNLSSIAVPHVVHAEIAAANLQPLLDCNAQVESFYSMLCGYRGDPGRIHRRYQDARRCFVKQHNFGTHARVDTERGTHLGAALRRRNSQAAIAQIV